jgi:hypothetical protein
MNMDAYPRSVRPGRFTTSVSALVSGGFAFLSRTHRRCVTAERADQPLDDAQLAQVAGGLDSPFLPDDEWTGTRR